MTEVTSQRGATLTAPSRQDVVSELLDDYAYNESYEADVSSKSALAPAFNEFPSASSRTDSPRDPKAEAIQRMNKKFQLRGKLAFRCSVSLRCLRSAGVLQVLDRRAPLPRSSLCRNILLK